MSLELKSQINKAEQEKDIKTLEDIHETAEVGFEGEIAGLAKAAIDRLNGKVEDAETTPDYITEKLGADKVEEVTANIDAEIEKLKDQAEEQIEGVVNKNESEDINEIKTKKFKQFEQWFKNDFNKEQNNPDSVINKVSKSAEEYKEALNEQFSSLGYDSFSRNLKEKFNITQQELETSLPELYKKGFLSKEKYAYYINHESLSGNNLNILKLNSLVENTSPDILDELQNNDQNLTSMLGAWHASINNEIKKELSNKVPTNSGKEIFREPEKLLSLVSNAARFENKESVQEIVEKVVDEYLASGNNINRLKSKTGDKFPVLENLCDAGFTDQAIKIMEKSLGKGMPTKPIFELMQKGFLTEEQAKGIMDKAGALE